MPTNFSLPSTGPLTMAQLVASYFNPFFALLFAPPTVISGSSYALSTADASLINNSSVAMALTLPPSSLNAGRPLEIVNRSGQAINSAAANIIPRYGSTGVTSIMSSAAAGGTARLRADGTNWQVIQSST